MAVQAGRGSVRGPTTGSLLTQQDSPKVITRQTNTAMVKNGCLVREDIVHSSFGKVILHVDSLPDFYSLSTTVDLARADVASSPDFRSSWLVPAPFV